MAHTQVPLSAHLLFLLSYFSWHTLNCQYQHTSSSCLISLGTHSSAIISTHPFLLSYLSWHKPKCHYQHTSSSSCLTSLGANSNAIISTLPLPRVLFLLAHTQVPLSAHLFLLSYLSWHTLKCHYQHTSSSFLSLLAHTQVPLSATSSSFLSLLAHNQLPLSAHLFFLLSYFSWHTLKCLSAHLFLLSYISWHTLKCHYQHTSSSCLSSLGTSLSAIISTPPLPPDYLQLFLTHFTLFWYQSFIYERITFILSLNSKNAPFLYTSLRIFSPHHIIRAFKLLSLLSLQRNCYILLPYLHDPSFYPRSYYLAILYCFNDSQLPKRKRTCSISTTFQRQIFSILSFLRTSSFVSFRIFSFPCFSFTVFFFF